MQLAPKEGHCHIYLPHFNLWISISRNSVYIHFAIPDFQNMYCLLPMIHSNKTVWIQMCKLRELFWRCMFITLTSLAKCKLRTCWYNSWHTDPLIETDSWVAGRGTDLLVISNGHQMVFVSLWNVFTHTCSVHLQYLCKTCDKEKMLAKDFWIILHIWMKHSVSGKNKIWYPFYFFVWGLVYIMHETVKITDN